MPGSKLDLLLLPEWLGMLLFLATAAILLLAIPTWLWGWRSHRPRVGRPAGMIGGGALVVYAFFWLGGLMVAPRERLDPGTEIVFCGLDCHLHVSVGGAEPGATLGVSLRFRSDARQAPEWPGLLHYRLRDATGRECAAVDRIPAEPLPAGQTVERMLHFAGGTKPGTAALIVTWGSRLDLLVPGQGNPLVQRRKELLLPSLWACA